MDLLDTIYRAFNDYRKTTKENRDCSNERNYIRTADSDNDLVAITIYNLVIQTDWIDTIYEGLDCIEKCIAEERQFIRSNGEVVKIEKVKQVSKDSVAHLARHSNLIRRNTGENIIPDELFMTEKLSDYAVYENRFLYLLLCYLRDFIELRYDKIVEFSNKYHAKLTMDKSVNYVNKVLKYAVNMSETIDNDEIKMRNNPNKDVIEKISDLLASVVSYLRKPLMVEVSKTPMIKPPIVKTNVLKMNQNFKKAVELYDYITNYEGDGYSIEEKIKHITPFNKDMGDEYAESIKLQSFLTYKYANDLNHELKDNFLKEEERLKEEANQKHLRQLKSLRSKIRESQLSMEEYMLELEKRNKLLEKDSIELKSARQEIINLNTIIKELKEKIENYEAEIKHLNEVIVQKNLEIENMIIQHKKEIEELHEHYQNQIKELIDNYEAKINGLIEEYETKIKTMIEEYETKIKAMIEEYETKIQNLINEYEAKIQSLIDEYDAKINNLVENYENTIKELKESHEAEIKALNEEHENKVNEIVNGYETKIKELNDNHANEIASLTDSYEAKILKITTDCDNTINSLKESHNKEVNDLINKNTTLKENHQKELESIKEKNQKVVDDYMNKVASLSTTIEGNEKDIKLSNDLNKIYRDEKLVLLAEINTLRADKGLEALEEDFVTEERFNELELEYKTFKKIFKGSWQNNKKRIYNELKEKILNQPFEKKEKKNKKAKEETKEETKDKEN